MEYRMKKMYVCTIIGDGLTPATAFRAAIEDIVDPDTGMKAFATAVVIGTDANGQPTHDWCLVHAAGPNHKLAENDPRITRLSDHPPTVKLSSMTTPEKARLGNSLTARGIDVSMFSSADGMGDILEYLGKMHSQDFSLDKFDVSE
jgi:hypothetical protein